MCNFFYLSMCTPTCRSVVFHVFISAWIYDVSHHHCPDTVEQNKSIDQHQNNRDGRRKPQDELVLKHLPQRDGGQDKARVWKHRRPPPQVEVPRWALHHGQHGNGKPPEAQRPEEPGPDDGHHEHDARVEQPVHVGVEAPREGLSKPDKCQRGETRRADAHEQPRPVLPVWKARLHQPADHVGVHHCRDADAQPLTAEAADDDGEGHGGRLGGGDDGGDGAREHDGEDGEDPSRHHGLKAEGVPAAKDEGVLCYC